MPGSVSQSILFPACVRVLRRRLVPLHYDELTLEGLLEIGKNPELMKMEFVEETQYKTAFDEAAENVREKLLEKSRYGTAYIKKPYCVGIMQEWFSLYLAQKSLINIDAWSFKIHGSASASKVAAKESGMRFHRMKVRDYRVPESYRADINAKGQTIQAHVSEFFRELWPCFWLPPDNEGKWDNPCPHDFKLKLPNRTWLIDVMGPCRSELYEIQGKTPADLHLMAKIDGKDILWQGWRTGKDVIEGREFSGEQLLSPVLPIVMLNCYASNNELLKDWETFSTLARSVVAAL